MLHTVEFGNHKTGYIFLKILKSGYAKCMLSTKGGYDATIWAERPRHPLVQVTPPPGFFRNIHLCFNWNKFNSFESSPHSKKGLFSFLKKKFGSFLTLSDLGNLKHLMPGGGGGRIRPSCVHFCCYLRNSLRSGSPKNRKSKNRNKNNLISGYLRYGNQIRHKGCSLYKQ